MIKIQNKKGVQLGEAAMAVMSIILIAVLVIVSLVIFSSLHTATVTKNTAGSAANESISPTQTGIYLAAASLEDGACGAISLLYNGTTIIATGNVTQTGCLIKNATNIVGYTAMRASYPYTYSASSGASNASDSMVTNFSGYPALIGLVGTIIFLALVIGVLVASFAFGGKKGA